MRIDLLYNVQNKNHRSHFQLATRHCNLPKIGEEIFQQLKRNLASRADTCDEIFEDYRRHLKEKLRMNFLTSPWFICAIVVVDE
jgi:hypothetical protein